MGDNLNTILSSLTDIKTYLQKLNYERRKTPIVATKVSEAGTVYSQLGNEVSAINQKIQRSELDEADIKYCKDVTEKIKKVYQDILNFETQAAESLNRDKQNAGSISNMSGFDLKVATSLLPVMDDSESVTLKLIEAAEFYESMLNETGKSVLIKFILKTRISNNAKLRLKPSYENLDSLINDIKKHLLTKKSGTALQAKLFAAKQGDNSIAEFGKNLEDIFVNLTISQADGDSGAFDILRPINERVAVKRFASGLRNQRLGTIISARDFEFLKDAIRAAQDEETSSQNNGQQIFNMFRGRGNNRNSYTGFNRARSNGRISNSNYNRNFDYRNNNGNYSNFQQNNRSRLGNNNRRPQGHRFQGAHRGRSFTRGFRGSAHRQINFAEQNINGNAGQERLPGDDSSEHTFFRA